jgi:FKBP-type peptidyl-prolyl cis-trans isomerase FkpA
VRKRTTHLALLAALVVFAAIVTGCSAAPTPTVSTPTQPPAAASTLTTAPASPGTTAPVTTLKIEDKTVGTGAAAKAGDLVTVDYTGWLTDGTKFDSSIDAGKPFQFTVGQGEVIVGWDQGVAGMKVGGVRMLTVPPDLGYGAEGAGGVIPANATLVFEVRLLKIN